MQLAFLVGRILYGGYFFLAGIKHFKQLGGMAGYAQSKGVPAARAAVAGSGLLILLGGLGVILGVYPRWSLLLIVLFLVPVTFTMHRYWAVADPMAKMGEQINFGKNLALLGAALAMLSLPVPWWALL